MDGQDANLRALAASHAKWAVKDLFTQPSEKKVKVDPSMLDGLEVREAASRVASRWASTQPSPSLLTMLRNGLRRLGNDGVEVEVEPGRREVRVAFKSRTLSDESTFQEVAAEHAKWRRILDPILDLHPDEVSGVKVLNGENGWVETILSLK
jgi:hypothetical protein